MNVSVISDNATANVKTVSDTPYQGSALQSPEVSRLQLTHLLRRRRDTVSEETRLNRQTFWAAFMARQAATSANSNQG